MSQFLSDPLSSPQSPSCSYLLDRPQSAAFLNISVRLLDRLRAENKLIAVQVASKVLYRRSDLQAFVDGLARDGGTK